METRHGIAMRAPWCQMMNEDDYPSYQLVSQKGRFAHALVLIQQAFRTYRFRQALSALRLLPGVIPDILLHSIAHLCSGRALRNGIRYPVVGWDKVKFKFHKHFFEPTKPYEPHWNGIPIGRCCDSSESSDASWSSTPPAFTAQMQDAAGGACRCGQCEDSWFAAGWTCPRWNVTLGGLTTCV